MKNTIKTLPDDLQPYEKCKKIGVDKLSDSELLSCILKTGVQGKNVVELSEELLLKAGGSMAMLYDLSMADLLDIRGIGEVKAIQIFCILEMSKRISRSSKKKGIRLGLPSTIANYVMEDMRHEKQEIIRALFFDIKGNLISDLIVSKGSVSESVIPVREIFVEAFQKRAVYLVIVHNHPSGDPEPSNADLLVTERIRMTGELTDIQLMDHIIIGDNKYVSLKMRGYIT